MTQSDYMNSTSNSFSNEYVLRVSQNQYVDAAHVNNKARYINHSCEPNTNAIVWLECIIPNISFVFHNFRFFRSVQGKNRVAIVAATDIDPNQEITIHYGDEYWGAGTTCYCSATNCRSRRVSSKTNDVCYFFISQLYIFL